MNCLSWNCRGAENATTIRELVSLVRVNNPLIVFLCETCQKKEKMYHLRDRLGLSGFKRVSSEGLSGGLALFWHESLSIEIKSCSSRYIDAFVHDGMDKPPWRLTCVYGEPRTENRHFMWETIQRLRAESDLPWLLMGDFNEALWQFEHFSITLRPEGQMKAFREVLSVCALTDLGFAGIPYTYDNGRQGRANVRVRLDRAMADDSWRDIFSDGQTIHLVSPASDHCPILVKLLQETQPTRSCQPRRHYEIMWERAAELPEIIAAAWRSTGTKKNLGEIKAGLDSLMTHLQGWSKKRFGNTLKLEKVRKELEELRANNADQREIRRKSDYMHELLYREEMLWMQRSRIN